MGISFDKSGNMFVADTENNRVQCLKKSGVFSHIIGAGKQGSGKGELSNPTDTAVDSQGFLYVVDSGNSRLSVFTTQVQAYFQFLNCLIDKMFENQTLPRKNQQFKSL